MDNLDLTKHGFTRRDMLRAGLYGVGLGVAGAVPLPPLFARAASVLGEQGANDNRILVILELSGGNDGLNTLAPYGDDAYYRLRPTIGVKQSRVLKIDDHFGFNAGMTGFERLYKDGHLAIIHGCGYENPSFSHFSSMAYWQTAAPNSGEQYGWVGRLADVMVPDGAPNSIINIGARQSLAVHSRNHTPVVFDDPAKFVRQGFYEEGKLIEHVSDAPAQENASRKFLLDVAQSANDASALVRQAWTNYRSPVDYGLVSIDLPKVAALIAAKMPTRLYYASYRNNAFDTHVYQGEVHQRILTYTSDAVSGFMKDMERLGRADDVVMLIFSEFGRRVPENTSLGTDHGTANLMFVAGKNIKGGHYGKVPSLAALDPGDNLIYTTDFRRVYATVIDGWLGYKETNDLLRGNFETFPMFS